MVFSSPCARNAVLLLLLTLPLFTPICRVISGSNYFDDFDVAWGGDRGKILNNGELLTLSLDNYSGSGFQSRKQYLYGKIDMELKLVPGNSAGTVTAVYLSSGGGSDHDEIDFEFLGNVTGDPYTVHTNVYAQGKGDREQQFRLWFDPTKEFHTYSLVWNPRTIIFYVDRTPLREFKNLASKLVPFPLPRPMRLYSSLWNADEWATRGGLIKTDWSQAPFVASYRNFNVDACAVSNGPAPRNCSPWLSQTMDQVGEERMKWVHKNWMIYDYCTDKKRFPRGFPTECSESKNPAVVVHDKNNEGAS